MAQADGYLTSDAHVPIFGGDTPESIFGRVLGALYDILIANRPMAVDNPALRDAQVLVRATRVPTGSANVSILGVGMGMTQGTTVLMAFVVRPTLREAGYPIATTGTVGWTTPRRDCRDNRRKDAEVTV